MRIRQRRGEKQIICEEAETRRMIAFQCKGIGVQGVHRLITGTLKTPTLIVTTVEEKSIITMNGDAIAASNAGSH